MHIRRREQAGLAAGIAVLLCSLVQLHCVPEKTSESFRYGLVFQFHFSFGFYNAPRKHRFITKERHFMAGGDYRISVRFGRSDDGGTCAQVEIAREQEKTMRMA